MLATYPVIPMRLNVKVIDGRHCKADGLKLKSVLKQKSILQTNPGPTHDPGGLQLRSNPKQSPPETSQHSDRQHSCYTLCARL